MTDKQAEITEQTTKDHEAKKNLERYAALVWLIHSRRKKKPIDRNPSDS